MPATRRHVQSHVSGNRPEVAAHCGALVIRSVRQSATGQYTRCEPGRNAARGGSTGRARCWVLRERPHGPLGQDRSPTPARADGGRDRPYLENCTVDASITSVVAKLIRAHGGCLGTRSRRRT